jgi:hypothetical protein
MQAYQLLQTAGLVPSDCPGSSTGVGSDNAGALQGEPPPCYPAEAVAAIAQSLSVAIGTRFGDAESGQWVDWCVYVCVGAPQAPARPSRLLHDRRGSCTTVSVSHRAETESESETETETEGQRQAGQAGQAGQAPQRFSSARFSLARFGCPGLVEAGNVSACGLQHVVNGTAPVGVPLQTVRTGFVPTFALAAKLGALMG